MYSVSHDQSLKMIELSEITGDIMIQQLSKMKNLPDIAMYRQMSAINLNTDSRAQSAKGAKSITFSFNDLATNNSKDNSNNKDNNNQHSQSNFDLKKPKSARVRSQTMVPEPSNSHGKASKKLTNANKSSSSLIKKKSARGDMISKNAMSPGFTHSNVPGQKKRRGSLTGKDTFAVMGAAGGDGNENMTHTD